VWTADRILKHGGQTNAICQLCRSQPESALHILAKCPYSRVVWAGLSAWLGFNLQPSPMHSYHRIRSWWNDMIQQGGQGPRSAWTASRRLFTRLGTCGRSVAGGFSITLQLTPSRSQIQELIRDDVQQWRVAWTLGAQPR
jgi:hypothetical protein